MRGALALHGNGKARRHRPTRCLEHGPLDRPIQMEGSIEGSMQGSMEGSMEHSMQGSMQSSMECSMQGCVQGSMECSDQEMSGGWGWTQR